MEFGPLQLPAADASAAGDSLLCSRGLTGTAALILWPDPLLRWFLCSPALLCSPLTSTAGDSLLCSRGLTGTAALICYGQASLDPLLQRFLHSLLTLGSNCRKSINLEDLFQFVQLLSRLLFEPKCWSEISKRRTSASSLRKYCHTFRGILSYALLLFTNHQLYILTDATISYLKRTACS